MKLTFSKMFIAAILISIGTMVNAQHKLFLIGDSTCSDYNSSSAPRTGWGTKMSNHFDENIIQVDNRAKSGRSSKSFYEEVGAWNAVISAIQEGDFLMIQFGHNDQKIDDTTRYTTPYGTYQDFLKSYIDETRAKGAYPILVTSIHRNKWNSDETINDTHGDYPPAMRELSIEENVPLVDAHQLTETLFESLGEDTTTYEVFMNLMAGDYPNYPNGNTDNTHLQENGASLVAQEIAEALFDLSDMHDYLSVLDDVVGLDKLRLEDLGIEMKLVDDKIKIIADFQIDQIIITDMNGRIVTNQERIFSPEIGVEDWSSGIYGVVIISADKYVAEKIAIIH